MLTNGLSGASDTALSLLFGTYPVMPEVSIYHLPPCSNTAGASRLNGACRPSYCQQIFSSASKKSRVRRIVS